MLEIKLSRNQIFQVLNDLGIKHDPQGEDHEGWMPCLCQRHSDRNFGSCSINLNSGVFYCFPCSEAYSLITVIKEKKRFSKFKEVLDYLGLEARSKKPSDHRRAPAPQKEAEVPDISLNTGDRYKGIPLNPEKYSYTRQRGFTSEFIQHFKIEEVLEGKYWGRIKIPITDKEKGVYQFEFRKVLKTSLLQELYPGVPVRALVKHWDSEVEKFNLRLKPDKQTRAPVLMEAGKPCEDQDPRKIYLLSPKVLYPSGSRAIKRTVFQREALDIYADLFVCEGIAGIPKIWVSVSKNVTCLFGAEVVEEQIAILKTFKKNIYFLSDGDSAAAKSLLKFLVEVPNLYVIDCPVEDSHDDYVDAVKKILTNKESIPTAFQYVWGKAD